MEFAENLSFNSRKFQKIESRNPYLIGRWVDEQRGTFDLYIGKNGLKVVPYNQSVFVEIVFSISTDDEGDKVFVDGNTKGYCIVYVKDGKVKEIFIFRREATSNSNELEGVLKALSMFRKIPVFSDSSYAIYKSASRRVKKIKGHSGNIFHSIADYILQNV